MTSADFCLIILIVAKQDAFTTCERMPDRSPQIRVVIFRNKTTAFTISPESWASISCAALPGDLALYAVSVPFASLRAGSGSLLCTPASFRQNLAVLPLLSANTYVYIT
jgi:hypothetical protein